MNWRQLWLLGVCAGWVAAALAQTGGPVAPGSETAAFVIGPESQVARAHAAFGGVPKDVIKVWSRVRVTTAAPQGLNFYAVQVNFPNKTWAHGGLQFSHGQYRINWGGLVSRGGGSADYRLEDPAADLQLMQNGPDSERSAPYAWSVGREYLIQVERGKAVTLPPGDYVFIGKGPQIAVPNARTMWEWKLTIRPVDGHGPTQVSTLYDAADRVASFYVWNECGYGSCGQGQSAIWTMPVYVELAAPDVAVLTAQLRRF